MCTCALVSALSLRWLAMLTYLVASFVGFLHQHPPLVVQLHGHAAAAVGVFPHPAKELLQLPAQGGIGVAAGFGVTGARHQLLCRRGRMVSRTGLITTGELSHKPPPPPPPLALWRGNITSPPVLEVS